MVPIRLAKIQTKGNTKCLSIWSHRDFYYLLLEVQKRTASLEGGLAGYCIAKYIIIRQYSNCGSQLLSHIKGNLYGSCLEFTKDSHSPGLLSDPRD